LIKQQPGACLPYYASSIHAIKGMDDGEASI
jgi:hypothetical protein